MNNVEYIPVKKQTRVEILFFFLKQLYHKKLVAKLC